MDELNIIGEGKGESMISLFLCQAAEGAGPMPISRREVLLLLSIW